MKYSPLVFFALLLVGFTPLGQIEDDVVQMQALRLNGDLVEVFHQLEHIKAFELDRDNVLRPHRDYQLVYYRSARQFLLVPKAVKEVTSVANGNYEQVDLDGGVSIHCYCMVGNDDCSFGGLSETQFECKGSCGCGVAVTIKPGKNILEYQSPEENWRSFDE